MKLDKILEIISNKKEIIKEMAKEIGFTELMILDEKDDKLHFLVTSKNKPIDATNNQLDLKIVLENLLRCQVQIHVCQEIKSEFLNSYLEMAISIDESLENIDEFFKNASSIDIKSIEDEIAEEDDIFGKNREKYISKEMANIAKSEKWNALQVAVYLGNLSKVKELVKQDKNAIEHQDRLGNNAFLLAALYGRIEIFKWFLSEETTNLGLNKKMLSLDIKNNENCTPFLVAVYGRQLDFLRYLLEDFPNEESVFLTSKDRLGNTAIEIANLYNYKIISTYLEEIQEKKKTYSHTP